VISEPHFGSRVIDLDEKMIIDRFALRMAIECQVIRNLTIKHNPRDIEQLRMLAKNLDLYKRDEDDQDEFWKYHFDFHIKLAQLSRVDSFVAELKRLNLFDILRRTIVTYTKVKGKEVPERHHEKLIEAIESGDRELAEATMREHINFSGLVREEQF
jgi:DNA-binding GntR family transcriptional regulator